MVMDELLSLQAFDVQAADALPERASAMSFWCSHNSGASIWCL